MTKIMNLKKIKTTLKLDGKTFSVERLGRALVNQELENDLSVKEFLSRLNEEIERAYKEFENEE